MVCGSAISTPLFHHRPNTISVHNAFYKGQQQQLPITATNNACLQQQQQGALTLTASGEITGGATFGSATPVISTAGVYSPPPMTQMHQQQQPQLNQPTSPPQLVTASADVVQVCIFSIHNLGILFSF